MSNDKVFTGLKQPDVIVHSREVRVLKATLLSLTISSKVVDDVTPTGLPCPFNNQSIAIISAQNWLVYFYCILIKIVMIFVMSKD